MLEWLRYQLERWVLRGSLALVALLVILLSLIAALGASVAYYLPGHHFESYRSALWWAVLRISDPGYLSDDIPTLEIRLLSAVLSVVGMAITVGGIVAIVTQNMNRAIRALASATTPVPFSNHIVVLGWTDRTTRLLRDILDKERSRVVLLVEDIEEKVIRTVNRTFPKAIDREKVILRSGSSYRPGDLARAACQRARAIILPATARAVAGDPEAGPRTLQALMALRTLFEQEHPDRHPVVVVELVDRALVPTVKSTFPEAHILTSDRVVARVLRLALQSHGLSDFALDVALPQDGFRIAPVRAPELVGKRLSEAEQLFENGYLMGLLAKKDHGELTLELHPEAEVPEDGQVLVFSNGPARLLGSRRKNKKSPRRPSITTFSPAQIQETLEQLDLRPALRRILVLGWNEVAPDLIAELNREPRGRYEVDFLSTVPMDEREREVGEVNPDDRIPVRQLSGDPLEVADAPLVDLPSYSRFLILADRRVMPEVADVRSLAVVLALQRRQNDFLPDASVVVELLAKENERVAGGTETLVTPILAADLLSALTLRPKADVALDLTLTHQSTFFSRVVSAPPKACEDKALLAAALRQSGYALLHIFDESLRTHHRRLLIGEPVRGDRT